MKIKNIFKLHIQNYILHKRFPQSQIVLKNCFNPNRIIVGKASYGKIAIISFNTLSKLKIGNFCSIAQEVKFILDAEHNIFTFSSYPFKCKYIMTETFEALSKGDIVLDDDVWIGYGATILSGVHIGQGAVVAAGSIVTKNVPPYAIVGGVPAKIIKYRFKREIIDILLKIDFANLSKEIVQNNLERFYKNLENVSDAEWFYNLLN